MLNLTGDEMRKFVVDFSTVACEMDLWEKLVETTHLAAVADAITGGGPGWPVDAKIYFTNTWRLQKFRDGIFVRHLQRIANDSTSARIYLELPVIQQKQWWKIWS